LDIDLAPAVCGLIAQADQAVVGGDNPYHYQANDADYDPEGQVNLLTAEDWLETETG
jgi:hypothetical protein